MAKRQSMHFSKIIGTSVGADYAHEHIDRVIRIGDWIVMLSRSKASRRPARQTLAAVTPVGNSRHHHLVMLSRGEASRCPARETFTAFQGDTHRKQMV